jgi:iron(III) transport system ATP-binding protein
MPTVDAVPVADEDAILRVVHLEKRFRRERGAGFAAVDDVTVDIRAGSMVTVLGPSGCGKTTLLRCIAGLEQPSAGEIWSGSKLLSSGKDGILVPPERRDFGMMFQSYAVWPHMSVFGNVAYPLKLRRWSKAKIEERVRGMLDVVGIAHLRNEYPARLSGGQQQRVALARALVCDPKVILFDEPLSNVDAKVREELRVELLAMQKRIGFAGLYVTHDQEEAMVISDRVVVMNDGKVLQEGSPREVYGRPNCRFVARFIGVANLWKGRLTRAAGDEDGVASVASEYGELAVSVENLPAGAVDGDEVLVVARPEGVSVSREKPEYPGRLNVWPGVVRVEMFKGAHLELLADVGGHVVRGRGGLEETIPEGEDVYVSILPRSLRVLPKEANDTEDNKGSSGLAAEDEALIVGTSPAPGFKSSEESRSGQVAVGGPA